MSENPWFNFIANIALFIAAVLIVGGFLFFKQYAIAGLLLIISLFVYIILQFVYYAERRAEDAKHMVNVMTSLMAQQQEFYFGQINYREDLLRGLKPVEAHALNNIPIQPPAPDSGDVMVNFPTVDGVMIGKDR
jgi:hypothetical protein